MSTPLQQTSSPPRLSVVIPNYNSARYLPRALRSVVRQDLGPLEIVVVDDCSAEDPSEVVAAFGPAVRLIRHEKNLGPAAARNTGVAASSAPVLTFLDADDWWPDGFLSKIVPGAQPGTVICYDNFVIKEADLDASSVEPTRSDHTLCEVWLEQGPRLIDRTNMHRLLSITSLFKIVVHRDDFTRAGGFDARYLGEEDFHLLIKLAAHRCKLVVTEEPKGLYLRRAGSLLRSAETDSAKQLLSLRRWWDMFRDLPLEQPLPRQMIRDCRKNCAYFRARYTDASLRDQVRTGGISTLLKPATIAAAMPAIPGILKFRAAGLGRRVRSIARSVLRDRLPPHGDPKVCSNTPPVVSKAPASTGPAAGL